MIRSHVRDYSLYSAHRRTRFYGGLASGSDCVFDKATIKIIFKFNSIFNVTSQRVCVCVRVCFAALIEALRIHCLRGKGQLLL